MTAVRVCARPEEIDQARQRVERRLLAVPFLHLARDVAILIGRENTARSDPSFGSRDPTRARSQNASSCMIAGMTDAFGRTDIGGRDIRRHHADHIVIIEQSIEEAHECHADVASAFKAHVRRVEKDDE
jgi:hypothetical protein